MGGHISCTGASTSHKPGINAKILKQREIAALYNNIFEKEDRLEYLRFAVANLERIHQEKASVFHRIAQKRRSAFEEKLDKTLSRRKQLLLDVIATGIQIQDLERQHADIEHKYSLLWSLAYEDDTDDQLADWKRDMRRTRSHNDKEKAVPSPPIVPPNYDVPIFQIYYLRDSEGFIDNVSVSSSLGQLISAQETFLETEV